ncbi:MAG: response regulator [Lachnospiraceae bacterium]|nr:response regulator [Lachnospiraceae bacterium]MBR6303574.1 response regulator [Lachnospiraceae bacterium]
MLGTNLLFLSDRESFIVKSIIKNINAAGQECTFCQLSVDEIKKAEENSNGQIYLYIDDKNDLNEMGITYLRDLVKDKDFDLYVIGYKEDIEELKAGHLAGCVAGEFYRPINANQIVAKIVELSGNESVEKHRKHILVVDDSGVMLTTIKSWLDEKYRVTPVNSAMNAINFLSKERPDLILLDYEMPVCSGPKFLEMMRTDVDCGDIPVIFLTGHDDAESVKSVLSLKPAGYLLKSLPKETIVGEVDAFFQKQKAMM